MKPLNPAADLPSVLDGETHEIPIRGNDRRHATDCHGLR